MRRANDIEISIPDWTRLIGMDRQRWLAYQKSEDGSPHFSVISTKDEERSVTVEQKGDRFLSVSRRIGMTAIFWGQKRLMDGLNCQLSVHFAGGTKEIANGRVNLANGNKKIANGTVNIAGGVKKIANGRIKTADWDKYFAGGLVPLADGRGTHAWGPVNMWVSEMKEAIYQLSSRRGYEERSVTAEQIGNRFLSSFGMTDKLATCNLQPGAYLLTIKYNNSPSRRTAGTTKNAHLSELEIMGTGDNKLNPFFLILKHAKNCEQFSPLGEMPAGQRGGTVANINKTSAYET